MCDGTVSWNRTENTRQRCAALTRFNRLLKHTWPVLFRVIHASRRRSNRSELARSSLNVLTWLYALNLQLTSVYGRMENSMQFECQLAINLNSGSTQYLLQRDSLSCYCAMQITFHWYSNLLAAPVRLSLACDSRTLPHAHDTDAISTRPLDNSENPRWSRTLERKETLSFPVF